MRQVDTDLVLTEKQEKIILEAFIRDNFEECVRVFKNDWETHGSWNGNSTIENHGHRRGDTLFEIPIGFVLCPKYNEVQKILDSIRKEKNCIEM